MEFVKIGQKTWLIAVIRQICQSFFTAKVFYCMVVSENCANVYLTDTLMVVMMAIVKEYDS